MTFRGLTWDHPRGYAALEKAARDAGGIILWDRQPLEGFESAPISEVCAGYDLVVLDHPHLGDAIRLGCLQPLDGLLSAEMLAGIQARTLGPCYTSYEMDGHLWALPLDAAAQVSAGRSEMMKGDWPVTFADIESASRNESGFVMSLAGPHAFLSLLSLAAGLDDRFGTVSQGYFCPHHDPAIDLFIDLSQRSDPSGKDLNPIGILDQMAKGKLTYCPLIFGYVPYSSRDNPGRITFRDAPRARPGAAPRGVLGGTGIALTADCRPDPALLTHIEILLSPEMQAGMIPAASGQPSASAAWSSPAVNDGVSGFYLNTVDTLRNAFVRPRHAGFAPTQLKASAWLRNDAAGHKPSAIREKVNAILREAGETRKN